MESNFRTASLLQEANKILVCSQKLVAIVSSWVRCPWHDQQLVNPTTVSWETPCFQRQVPYCKHGVLPLRAVNFTKSRKCWDKV